MSFEDLVRTCKRIAHKNNKVPHHDAAQIHAMKRVAQRYNFILTVEEYFKLVKMVANGNCDWLEKQAKHRSEVRIKYMGKEFYVIWDKKLRRIVTFLEPCWSKHYEKPPERTVVRVRTPEEGTP